MLSPGPMEPYVGFNEDEVSGLCANFGSCRSVFPPHAVVAAFRDAMDGSQSDQPASSFFLKDQLVRYLSLTKPPREELRDLLSGRPVFVRTDSFLNDFFDLRSAYDVRALLAHCGWLSFDPESSCVRIPNTEIRSAFLVALG